MQYFKPTFVQFFKDLAKNNHKDWFDTNRKTYEHEVKKPFSAFVEEMIARIAQHEPGLNIKASDAIMRINRDIRFSKDKTPYNTHMAANISLYGKKDKSYPGFYFQISPEGIMMAGGVYMADNPTLHRIRQHIAGHLSEFAEAYNDKDFKQKFGGLQGEQNKRIPPEFQDASKKEALIANKQFYYSASLGTEAIISEELPERLMQYYLSAKKINAFLQHAWKA